MVKDNRVPPLATMNVWTKFNRRLNHLILSRHFPQNQNLILVLEEKSEDHQSLQGSFSGNHECLHGIL